MADQHKPVIWLIDENEYELRTHRAILAKILTEQVEIRALQPYPNLDDNTVLLEDPRTACIIIDQKIKEAGIAGYAGIDLARFLRAISPKLPIYILTNFAAEEDEFAGSEWSVEDIIAKGDMVDTEKRQTTAARILRRINVYHDILGERETRFRVLLKRSLEADLSADEQGELDELLLQRSAHVLVEELKQIKQLQEIIEAHESLMSAIDQANRRTCHDAQ